MPLLGSNTHAHPPRPALSHANIDTHVLTCRHEAPVPSRTYRYGTHPVIKQVSVQNIPRRCGAPNARLRVMNTGTRPQSLRAP